MDIKNMLEALIAQGLSQSEIAITIGVSQPTIHRALRGRQVIYETGKALERLYASRCMGRSSQPFRHERISSEWGQAIAFTERAS